jgi:NAD(P)-dependent dehydrogenase (short-subunit alcohol dehydrogenase family)
MSEHQSDLALVTGAAGGIGAATVRRLLSQGLGVIALDRTAGDLAGLKKQLGAKGLIPLTCDLSRPWRLPAVVKKLVQQYGPITRLVNNAGVWPAGPVTELSDQAWELTFAVNVTAPFVLIREVAPVMAKTGGGAIVNVASRNAFRSSTNHAAYDASKAALVGLTRTAAGELARHNIRVNAVCPGVIDTPATTADLDELFMTAYRKLIPMDRYGSPEEIASVIAFLLSDDASFVTGSAIIADGGQMACQDNQRFMEVHGLKVRRRTRRQATASRAARR